MQKQVKEYFYIKNYKPSTGITGRSSGVLSSIPKYLWVNYEMRAGNDPNQTLKETIFSAQPAFPFTENNSGPHITYSEVVEKNTDGSIVDYKYTHYESKDEIKGHKDDPFVNTLQPLTSPYEPISSLAFTRGRLLSKETYDREGKLLEREYMLYKRVGPQTACRATKSYQLYPCPQLFIYYVISTAYNNYTFPFLVYKSYHSTFNPTNPQDSLTHVMDYEYDQSSFQPLKITANISDGTKEVTKLTYPFNYSSQNQFISSLQQNFIHNSIIEKVKYREDPATQIKTIQEGEFTFYHNNGLKDSVYILNKLDKINYDNYTFSTVDASKNLKLDSRLKKRATYLYNSSNFLIYSNVDNKKTSYLWDEVEEKPIAVIENAEPSQVFFNNFEKSGDLNFFRSGRKSYSGNFQMLMDSNPLNKIRGGTLSYWYYLKSSSTWTYAEEVFNGQNISITGKDNIDDIRIFPKESKMTTYTHLPLVGVSSVTNENNLRVIYEYDALGRLIQIKDDKLNVIKRYTYSYYTSGY